MNRKRSGENIFVAVLLVGLLCLIAYTRQSYQFHAKDPKYLTTAVQCKLENVQDERVIIEAGTFVIACFYEFRGYFNIVFSPMQLSSAFPATGGCCPDSQEGTSRRVWRCPDMKTARHEVWLLASEYKIDHDYPKIDIRVGDPLSPKLDVGFAQKILANKSKPWEDRDEP